MRAERKRKENGLYFFSLFGSLAHELQNSFYISVAVWKTNKNKMLCFALGYNDCTVLSSGVKWENGVGWLRPAPGCLEKKGKYNTNSILLQTISYCILHLVSCSCLFRYRYRLPLVCKSQFWKANLKFSSSTALCLSVSSFSS